MIVAEGMACPMPGSSKLVPAPWPMPTRETLRELESFGYDYQYVGQGMYRVWVKGAHTRVYLNAHNIDVLIEKHQKRVVRAQRKKEREEQVKKNATKGKATPKRRRQSRRLR